MRRSMALLWRADGVSAVRTSPGPKPGLSVDEIVDAAIAIADASGIGAVSMREVGKRLGRTGMALYTYVPGKSELVDLMYDRALGELPRRYDLGQGWRVALTAWAADYWACCLRHPWTLQVSQVRPVLGPNEYASLDALLGILFETGLKAGVLRRIVGALIQYVRGVTRTVADSREAAAATGISDEDWWVVRSAIFGEVTTDFAKRFPMVARLEAEGASVPPDGATPYLEREATATFVAGLAILLHGIEVAVRDGSISESVSPDLGGRAATT